MGEERTPPPVRHCTRIGYHGAGRLSREIFTHLAQEVGTTSHHQDTKAPSENRAIRCNGLSWCLGVLVVHRAAIDRRFGTSQGRKYDFHQVSRAEGPKGQTPKRRGVRQPARSVLLGAFGAARVRLIICAVWLAIIRPSGRASVNPTPYLSADEVGAHARFRDGGGHGSQGSSASRDWRDMKSTHGAACLTTISKPFPPHEG